MHTPLLTPRSRLLIAVFTFGGSAASAQVPPPANPPRHADVIAFVHANVIPMDSDRVVPDQTVIITNKKITALGPAASVKVPPNAIRVDATGKYLLPALSDMHVHLLGEAWGMMQPPNERLARKDIPYEKLLFPYVANGVTTVQALSGTAEDMAVRRRIEGGELLGPRLILAPMIDAPQKAWPPPISTWVATPAEARAAVRHAKAEGYDRIKVYSFLTREMYDTIIDAARDVGIGVIGHVPMSVSVEHVLASGQQLIAHSEEIAKHAGSYTPERVDYFATAIADRGVWLIPTLVTTRAILELFEDSDKLLHRPEAAYFQLPMEQGVWSFITTNLYLPIPPDARAELRKAFIGFQQPLTIAMHRKGGRLLAGSDAPLPGLVPGFALHRELQELVAVGLTPFEALRTSTTAPSEYLGESERAGTVAVGKSPDLILVDANPLEDIAAASGIAGVWMRGRWIPREEIRKRMH